MKRFSTLTFSLLFVLFLVTFSLAGSAKDIWRPGHIHFWNHQSQAGDISYNWSAEMVSLRQPDGRVLTYSAHQVARFGWFDHEQSRQRTFMALEKPLDQERSSHAFFEICLDGPLTVVRRLRKPHGLFKTMFSHPTHLADQPMLSQNTDLFDYFVFDAGRLLAMNKFYQDIYEPLMAAYHRELRQYIITHNINDRALAGRLVLIDRYNAMVQHDSRTASNKSFSGANE